MIPQIMAVFGTCGGGMAVSAAMADFTFMEESPRNYLSTHPTPWQATIHPSAIPQRLPSRAREAGVADFTGDEASILEQIRSLVSILPSSNEEDLSYGQCQVI